MLKKYDRGASKDVCKIVTGDESWIYAYESETKQQSTVWVFEDDPSLTKVLRGRSTSTKLLMWRLFRLSNERQSILSGTQQFVCLKSWEKFEKRTREDESLFTMTHRLKPAPFWPAKTSNWWVIRRTALTWHPMTSFYSRTSRKKMRGQRFSSPENAVDCCCQSEWKKCFDN